MTDKFIDMLREECIEEGNIFHTGADPYEQMETARKKGDRHAYEMWKGIADAQRKASVEPTPKHKFFRYPNRHVFDIPSGQSIRAVG
jgi:hypothetical protein